MTELGRMSPSAFKSAEKFPVLLVLDNIRSLHNVGAAFRTADAFRIQEIMLCGITGSPPHPEIERSALGATSSVKWTYYTTTEEAVKYLKALGYCLVAVEQTDQSQLLGEQTWSKDQPLALIFGNELLGVSDEVLPLCDYALEIPQLGTKHSLNVSVSIGIVLWELLRSAMKTLP